MVLSSRRNYFGQPTNTKPTNVQNYLVSSILLSSWTLFWAVIKNFLKHPFSSDTPKSRLTSVFLFFCQLQNALQCAVGHTPGSLLSAVVVTLDQRSRRNCWLQKQASLGSNLKGFCGFCRAFQALPLVPHSLHSLLSCWSSSCSGEDETQKPRHHRSPTNPPLPTQKAYDSNK